METNKLLINHLENIIDELDDILCNENFDHLLKVKCSALKFFTEGLIKYAEKKVE